MTRKMATRSSIVFVFLLSSTGCAATAHTQSRPGWYPMTDAGQSRPGWYPMTGAPAKKPAAIAKAAPAAKPTPAAKATAVAPSQREGAPAVVAAARAIASGKAAPPARKDCSGFVSAAYARAGVPLEIPERYHSSKSAADMLYRWAKAEGRSYRESPRPGDLVFFRDTYGAIRGEITHVGLVESIAADGTVTVLHHLSGRIQRSSMSLEKPRDPKRNGYLRKKLKASDPHLAGELFVAYARYDGKTVSSVKRDDGGPH